MSYPQSIVTNARTGRKLSRNRRRSHLGRPAIALLVIAFWCAVAIIISIVS
jgi:cytochrome b